jgi:hypothetical protein
MNVSEFISFIEAASSLSTPPSNPFRDDWEHIRKQIEPHFYGEVPHVLEESFPNEDPEILAYRKQTYQPKTESPVVKAITDLSRLLSSAKHSILFDNNDMENWFRDYKIGDDDLFRYFFKVVTPNRVSDPNALMVVEPTGDGLTSDRVSVDVKFSIIQSDRVIFNDPDYNLIIYKGVSKPKYTNPAQIGMSGIYMVVTDQFYGRIDNGSFTVLYEHQTGLNPWFTLGGRAIQKYDTYGNTYTIYKSDFSAAVPYLNDAAIFDNQHKSVMLSTCFPIKFVDGIDCDTCSGMGRIADPHDHDKYITCGDCHGHGKKLFISPLAGYNLSPEPMVIGTADDKKQRDPIRFYSPDTSTIQMTSDERTHALDNAKTVLNIDRSLKSAQSGIAKEMDREPEYLEIGRISDDMYSKLNHTLSVVQGLIFMDTTSNISVNPPVSFDIKNETELMAEFAASQQGMDASIRYGSYLSYIDQRYSQNETMKRIAQLSAAYTTLMLFTIDERNKMLAAGQITQDDAIKATYVFDTILELHFSGQIDIFEDEMDSIVNAIDSAIEPKISDLSMVEPDPQFGDDQEMIDEDEEQEEIDNDDE